MNSLNLGQIIRAARNGDLLLKNDILEKNKALKAMFPKEMIVNKGNIIDNFKSTTGFTPQGCTAVVDTTKYKYGNSSIKLTPTAPGTNFNISKTGLSLNLSTMQSVSIWVYVEDASKMIDVGIYLTCINGNYNYLHTGLVNGWNHLKINKQYMTKSGASTAWTDTFTGFIARGNLAANATTNIYFGSLLYDVVTTPKAIFTFDDGYNGVYNLAYPYMKSRGVKGTSFVCQSLTGAAGYMPMSQLKTMYDDGWDIANHTKTHIDLTSVSTDAAIADIVANKNWLHDNGFTRCNNLLCYPMGYYTQAILDRLPGVGINCARTVTGIQQSMPPADTLTLKTLAFGSGVTASLLKTQFDLAVLDGSTAVFTAHQIVASGATGNQTNLDVFKDVLDYVMEKQVDIIPLSVWYEQLNY